MGKKRDLKIEENLTYSILIEPNRKDWIQLILFVVILIAITSFPFWVILITIE